jgi:chromosome segregation ATPase
MELIWIAIIGFVLLMGLALFIYHLPAEKFKRKRAVVPPPVKEKDWEAIAKRWEKTNSVLTNEVESLKKERRSFIEQLEDDKKIVQEQLEQLAREKAWREKETQVVEKVKNVDHELKEELRRTQNMLNEEHSQNLKTDIELQETRIALSKFKEEARALTVKVMALEKEYEGANKELRELRRANSELKKQKEDIQWIAKSDYDEAVMKLKKVESELARLTRDQNTDTTSS